MLFKESGYVSASAWLQESWPFESRLIPNVLALKRSHVLLTLIDANWLHERGNCNDVEFLVARFQPSGIETPTPRFHQWSVPRSKPLESQNLHLLWSPSCCLRFF